MRLAIGWLVHLRDRMAHAERRRVARQRIQAMSPPREVLVVCHGNRCRSPFAAALLDQRFAQLHSPIRIVSAGYAAPNQPCPADAIAAAAVYGVDLSAHRSRQVTRPLLSDTQLVLVMDAGLANAVAARTSAPREVIVLGDLDPLPIRTRAIADPMGRPRPVFDECYARIHRCVTELAAALVARHNS